MRRSRLPWTGFLSLPVNRITTRPVASKRHHRRYSSLEPTREFGWGYAKLERMNAPRAGTTQLRIDLTCILSAEI